MNSPNTVWQAKGYLDCDDHHPALLGDCIMLRDDDGMGFALELDQLKGRYVKVTIEAVFDPRYPNEREPQYPKKCLRY